MAAIVNDRDVLLQAAGTRLLAVALPSNTTVDFSLVNGTTKPSNNADVTVTVVNGGLVITSGGITLNAGGAIKGGQTSFNTGVGWFLGYAAGEYVFSIANAGGHKIAIDSSGLAVIGNISGAGNIDITGQARFGGSRAVGVISSFAVIANESGGSASGVYGKTSVTASYGVYGQDTSSGSTSAGLFGDSVNGSAAQGTASGAAGFGVQAVNTAGGKALNVSLGLMAIANSTVVPNLNAEIWNGIKHGSLGTGTATATSTLTNKPGNNTANTWLSLTDTTTGLVYDIQIWPRV